MRGVLFLGIWLAGVVLLPFVMVLYGAKVTPETAIPIAFVWSVIVVIMVEESD